jgi:hypothetical protein
VSLNTIPKKDKTVTIRKDLQRVKCFYLYNRKKDVTDNETSGYPSNSKFIQTQKKREQNDKKKLLNDSSEDKTKNL